MELHERSVDELEGSPRNARTPTRVWLPWTRLGLYAIVALAVLPVTQ